MNQAATENVSSRQKHLVGYRKSDGALMYDERFYLPHASELDDGSALLRLVSYIECVWYPGAVVQNNVQTPDISLSLCTTGSCEIHREAYNTIVQKKGDLIVYKRLKSETLKTHGSEIFRKKVLILHRSLLLNELFNMLFPDDITLIHLPEPELFEQSFAYILECVRSESPSLGNLSVELFRLLQELHRQIVNKRFSPKLEETIRVILATPKLRINRDELAQFCKMSVSSLNRMFQEELHCPPAQYIQRIRMKTACRYLVGTKMLIKQIAEECGFINSKHFASEFHKFYGVTPSQYRSGETGK